MLKKLILVSLTFWVAGSGNAIAHERTSESAWNDLLVPTFTRIHKDGFEFVEHQKDIPNVFLYGDSISIHYTKHVRNNLKGDANVYRLHTNGGSSFGFISNMNLLHSTMKDKSLINPWDFQWDIIHFNVGLHDLKYTYKGKLNLKEGSQVSTIKGYKHRLRHIVQYLKVNFPNTKLIFATSTPIPEGTEGRVSGDAARYNEAALEVLKDYPEIKINDLYNFTKDKQEHCD